jgi:hypothetical protein
MNAEKTSDRASRTRYQDANRDPAGYLEAESFLKSMENAKTNPLGDLPIKINRLASP